MLKWKQLNEMEMILGSENVDLRIPSPASFMTLGKSLNFSEFPFPHLPNDDNNSSLIG